MIVQVNEGKFGGKLGVIKFSHPFQIIDTHPKIVYFSKLSTPDYIAPSFPQTLFS